MRLLDDANDLELFGSLISHASPPPSPVMLFFKQAQFEGLLGDDLPLMATGDNVRVAKAQLRSMHGRSSQKADDRRTM